MYTKNLTYDSGNGPEGWMYAIAILLPMIGIILGLIYLARKEDSIGKSLLIAAIVANIVWVSLFFLIFNVF